MSVRLSFVLVLSRVDYILNYIITFLPVTQPANRRDCLIRVTSECHHNKHNRQIQHNKQADVAPVLSKYSTSQQRKCSRPMPSINTRDGENTYYLPLEENSAWLEKSELIIIDDDQQDIDTKLSWSAFCQSKESST